MFFKILELDMPKTTLTLTWLPRYLLHVHMYMDSCWRARLSHDDLDSSLVGNLLIIRSIQSKRQCTERMFEMYHRCRDVFEVQKADTCRNANTSQVQMN